MSIPKVAIVGRPNVGKSSLFNWMVGKRVSIVEPTAGVTRDRIGRIITFEGRTFELVDTGGMGIEDRDGLTRDVEGQIKIAIKEAAVVLFAVDGQSGFVPLDQLVSDRLRQCRAPILCLVNKCDTAKIEERAQGEFERLGREILFVSVMHNRRKEELFEKIVERLPKETQEGAVPEPALKVAIVGRRNAGKSTFINSVAGIDRVIVSETPGTTRDSVDVRFDLHGKSFVAIDTAGIRRRGSLGDSIEFYSQARTEETIRRADVVVLFIDAYQGIGKIDKQLSSYIIEHHKPCIIAVNKWDLMAERDIMTGAYNDRLDYEFPGLSFAPRIFLTAKTGKNVQAIIDVALSLHQQSNLRISTGELNRLIRRAYEQRKPPLQKQKQGKMFYVAQVQTNPPTFVIFCNDPSLFSNMYRRFLAGYMRDHLEISEVPLRLEFRPRADRRKMMDALGEAGLDEESSAVGSLSDDDDADEN